jgi:hypothetical protein
LETFGKTKNRRSKNVQYTFKTRSVDFQKEQKKQKKEPKEPKVAMTFKTRSGNVHMSSKKKSKTSQSCASLVVGVVGPSFVFVAYLRFVQCDVRYVNYLGKKRCKYEQKS